MTTLTDIIQVQISRETTAVSRAGFNTPLFLATHSNFKERARVYSSLTAVASDFNSTSNVYIAAAKMFGQELVPSQIVIGRRQIGSFTVSIGTVANSTQYKMTINGNDYTFTSSASATAATIVTGLLAAYNTSAIPGITTTNNSDGTFLITSTIDWSFKVGDNLTASAAPSTETWVDALAAVEAENNTWFGLTAETHVEADVLALAAAIEGRKKIYGVSTAQAAVKTTATTDIISKLKALGYDKTFAIFSENADSEFPEAGLMAGQLQEQPGSNTWAYNDIKGATVSTLNSTVSTNIQNKNGMTFEVIGGARSTTEGKMVSGEYIDVMVFALWLEARLVERIWFRLRNSKKIPYTKAGATIIEAEIRAQLTEGVRVGGLAPNPAFTITMPNVLDVAANLRAGRVLEGITFEARLAGAIQKVKISGTVTV